MGKSTTIDLICQLERLPGPVAAWALGVAPRTLRDRPELRNVDGTYNVRTLVQWASRRAPPAAPGEEMRQLLDFLRMSKTEGGAAGVLVAVDYLLGGPL